MTYETQFRFGSQDWRLFHSALNEVLHGFNVSDFERTIGADRETLLGLLDHLGTLGGADQIQLGLAETRAIRNALRETVRELGVYECHTRTGYGFEEAKAVLAKLDGLLVK